LPIANKPKKPYTTLPLHVFSENKSCAVVPQYPQSAMLEIKISVEVIKNVNLLSRRHSLSL